MVYKEWGGNGIYVSTRILSVLSPLPARDRGGVVRRKRLCRSRAAVLGRADPLARPNSGGGGVAPHCPGEGAPLKAGKLGTD